MSSQDITETIREKVREVVDSVIPTEYDLKEIKEEVWIELATIYYKYESEAQKRAFREVMKEISDKIQKGEWRAVYNKLYRLKKIQPSNK